MINTDSLGEYIVNPFFTSMGSGWGIGGFDSGQFHFSHSSMNIKMMLLPAEPTPEGTSSPFAPQLITNETGDAFSFNINQTTAFCIYGSLAPDHDSFIATITQLPNGKIVTQGTYSQISRWLESETVFYFGTGLDPTSSYNVSLQNVGAQKYLAVRNLDLIQVLPYVSLI
jgi:hypothetical protein